MSKKKITFEEAMSRLEEIVRELEDGQMPLEKSLDLYSEGIKLSKLCQSALDDAEQRIMVLTAEDELQEVDKPGSGIGN